MAQVIMNTARTENGYSCVCDLLPGWVVGLKQAMSSSSVECQPEGDVGTKNFHIV